ncbi:hypothetical protein M2342_000543 [Sphingobium sp. B8D3A]|nr:hypothetical protein [Sphingobium sp. B8D3A]
MMREQPDRLYDDPRLDAYFEEARATDTDLRVAETNLRWASAVVQEEEAGKRSALPSQAMALARVHMSSGGISRHIQLCARIWHCLFG